MRPALDGQTWAAWQPEIQNAGVDTLEFSFDIEIGQAMWDRLEEEKGIAQMLMKTRKAEHVPDWLNAVVHPVGAKGGYRFLLDPRPSRSNCLRACPTVHRSMSRCEHMGCARMKVGRLAPVR